ncbi:tyrosine-type recombinase/integrase [Acidithiobacillus thiooxidans]|uniref:Tyr recombinase domain-containing protein n=2 Tax=Acidithiobacillus thiooxidans TaxID=930 RepID=A0A1C2IFL8_ACITH|nr:site-specific integrase [Acidithiobacillus thiooxidans]MBU2836946.1 tyrosine-type recombinase/integrase [Acidithiobacillus thiooxidans]OCX74792.1 hypothetical protein A6M23_04885 [Acidithiobacillus thiooxidans]OCX79384.1 hypothetical protein A6P08_17915 [Acidithiobacillus thiooxidans]QFX96741.1 integrase [Acidithiobacillus thiooxidans ATCC 19377]
MATIFQRGKFWRAQIRRSGYPALTATFDSKLAAQRWAVEKESEIQKNSPERLRQRIEMRQFTLNDALDRYEREVLPAKSANARKIEPTYCRNLRAVLGPFPLADLDGAHLSRTLRQWDQEKSWSPNTVRLHLALLSFLFGVARKEWGMPDLVNPVPLVRKPKLPRGRDRRLVGDEESRLLAACSLTNPELADIVIFAIETAMRQGEIMDLEWRHINWLDHIAYLPETKNGSARLVPLSERAEAVLQRQQARTKDQNDRVWKYTNNGMRAVYNRAVKRAGIEGLTFHDLRHEATSRLVEKGIPIMTAQAITGHKSTQMLKRYTHISAQSLVQAVRGQN